MTHIDSSTASPAYPKGLVWTGRVLSAVVVLMMGVMSIIMLFTNRAMMAEGFKQQGYPESAMVPVVIVEIVCAFLYAIPQTAVLGAILLTGYLGGAVATHVRRGAAMVHRGDLWRRGVAGPALARRPAAPTAAAALLGAEQRRERSVAATRCGSAPPVIDRGLNTYFPLT